MDGVDIGEQIVPDLARDGHIFCLSEAAKGLGIPTGMLPPDRFNPDFMPELPWLRLEIGPDIFFAKRQCIWRLRPDGRCGHVSAAAQAIVDDKQRTKNLLDAAGFSTPRGAVFHRDRLHDAFLYAAESDRELCVKPNRGRLGDLVFPYLRRAMDIAEAITAVTHCYDEVLIEQSMPGDIWRFVYVEPDVIAAKLSRPASIMGDGHATVEALVTARKAERQRRQVIGHHDCPDGHAVDFMLDRQGLRRDSIPAAGRRVFLHPASNGAMGADSITMPGLPHADFTATMARAFQTIPHLFMGTADVAVIDPRQPARPDNYAILDINARPGLLPYHYPWEGPTQDISTPILRRLQRLVAE